MHARAQTLPGRFIITHKKKQETLWKLIQKVFGFNDVEPHRPSLFPAVGKACLCRLVGIKRDAVGGTVLLEVPHLKNGQQ